MKDPKIIFGVFSLYKRSLHSCFFLVYILVLVFFVLPGQREWSIRNQEW